MDFSLAKEIIDWAGQSNIFSYLSLTSLGEPLLHPRLIDIIKEAKKTRMKVFLATNGSLLTKERVHSLIEADLDFLVLGINASNEQEYNLKRCSGTFDAYISKIMEVTKEFIAPGHTRLILSYISTGDWDGPESLRMLSAEEERKRLFDFWNNYFNKNIGPGSENTSKQSFKDQMVELEGDEGYHVIGNIYLRIKPMEFDLSTPFVKRASTLQGVKEGQCSNIESDFTILSNGDATFCCQKDFDGSLALGNVKNETVESIYSGTKAMNLRKLNARGYLGAEYCQKCVACSRMASSMMHSHGSTQ